MQTLEKLTEYEIERNKQKPSKNHAILQKRLIVSLSNLIDSKLEVLSEIALDLADWEFTPDIAIFQKMEINFSIDEVRITQAPLCVVEILSPTQSLQDLTDKIRKYFEKGVQSAWLVLPALKSIYVYSSADEYKAFTFEDTLKDAKLEIELQMQEIFG